MNLLLFAAAGLLALSPSKPGDFTYVKDATPEKVAELAASGKKVLVEDHDLTDYARPLEKWGATAAAVAFDAPPPAHMLHTWKGLGVTVLKTINFDPEASADRIRREVGFLAFQSGVDGVFVTSSKSVPDCFKAAYKEAKEDWRILSYLKELSDKAAKHPDSKVWIESRRVTYWFGYMPAGWENLDTLRLETVAYAKRLEQLLGVKPADLPVTASAPIKPQTTDFKPYGDWPEKPFQKKLDRLGSTVDFGNGLLFSADANGFSISYKTTVGPTLKQWASPGGAMDCRVYVLGKNGAYLPYRFHVDLDPVWHTKERAPARGRGSFLYGIDERFRPYSSAYGVSRPRVQTWPRLGEYGPDYPNPRPGMELKGNKEGGWTATVRVSWASLYGHWPMQRKGKQDVWFVGIDRAPNLEKPIAGRVLWPKGHGDYFMKLAAGISTGTMTGFYKEELNRTYEVWMTALRENFYPFAKTEKPTFHRYDFESDNMFRERLLQPLLDQNANAWEVVWTDKEHKPTFAKQNDAVKAAILKNLGRMFYLSHATGLLRRDYLVDRFAGKEPPKYVKKVDNSKELSPDSPDADYNGDDIQLDDKEF